MPDMLNLTKSFPLRHLAAGEVFLSEGERTDRLFVLAEGAVEVFRGDVTIALVTEPGSVFGEMSLLLDMPHTADVRAAGEAKVHVIDEALQHLRSNPAMVLPIAQLLARRLRNSTTYLVDLKKQFEDHSDHFAMVDQVLESLVNQQDEQFTPGGELPSEP